MSNIREFVLQKAVEIAAKNCGPSMMATCEQMTPTQAAEAVVGAYLAAVKALDAVGDQSSPQGAQ